MTAVPQVFAMSITPFDSNYELDEVALRAHLERLASSGTGVYLGSPGTGEGHSLSAEELARVYATGVEVCGGRVPVYANPPETRVPAAMYERVMAAHRAGVDLVQIYTVDAGHGMRPTWREQERYYRELLDEIDFPVGLSINILAGGYVNPVDLLIRLVEDYPQITCVNVNHPPTAALAELVDAIGNRVRFYTDAFMYPEALTLGASGCLTGHANVLPHLLQALGEALVCGDVATASEQFRLLFRVQRAVSAFGTDAQPQQWSGRWIKAAMAVLDMPGHSDGRMRPPHASPTEEDIADLAECMRPLDLGVLESHVRSN